MRLPVSATARKWLGASALAIAVALGGITAFTPAMTTSALAQVSVAPGAPSSFADLVEAVKPAVVSINIDGKEDVRQMGPQGFFDMPDLPEDHPLRKFFEQFGDQFGERGQGREGRPDAAPRPPRHFQAAGSGFIISADGYVVTNNHVVERADTVTVIDDEGNEHAAEVIGTDPRTDLALVKIKDAKDLPFVEFADKDVRVGDWVVAVGNPFGLGGTVTAGIVSARSRDIAGSAYGDFIQIDAAVNRGNSGGPTFGLDGKVVGVNTAIFSPNGGNVGIAFAIPAAIVKQVIDDLKDDGQVTRGYLGVGIQDVNKDIADSVGLPHSRGALVTEPNPDTPAAKAGIKSGDIIVAVDGDEIDNALDLSRTIGSKAPGSEVTVSIWRNREKIDLKVTLDVLDEKKLASNTDEGKAQPAKPDEPVETSVGLTLVPNADGEGLIVKEIDADSIAATKGFAVGDIILEANNVAVASSDDFEAQVKAVREGGNGTILIKAMRGGNVRFLGLPLEKR